jgi:hypothetical protein
MANALQQSDFSPLVNKEFRFEGQPHPLRLAAVEAHNMPGTPQSQRAPFTLIFHGAPGQLLPEGLYAAEAEGGARFDLYVMPIHTTSLERQDYQAVFN